MKQKIIDKEGVISFLGWLVGACVSQAPLDLLLQFIVLHHCQLVALQKLVYVQFAIYRAGFIIFYWTLYRALLESAIVKFLNTNSRKSLIL